MFQENFRGDSRAQKHLGNIGGILETKTEMRKKKFRI